MTPMHLPTAPIASSDAGPEPESHAALESALRSAIRGEVRFDAGSRALYATDASSYRQVPIGVVIPRDTDDVIAAVRIARDHEAPILCRGGGTSLAGQCCNTAIVLDFSKYMGRVLEVNVEERWARVEPGTVLDDLREATRPHGLTFGPDPATHTVCTLGGMIGNNSCGVHSVQAGFFGPGPRTEHQVLELTVLTYDGQLLTVGPTPAGELDAIIERGGRRGEIYAGLRDLRDRYADLIRTRFPDIPRRVSGYNLPALLDENGFDIARALVGTESTCAVVLEARVTLIPDPPCRVLLVLGYETIYEAADHVPAIMGQRPLGLEGMDYRLVDFMKAKVLNLEHLVHLPVGQGWLFVEFGGDSPDDALARAQAALAALRAEGETFLDARILQDPLEQRAVWIVRESGLGATAFVPGQPATWEGWEDAAVAPEHLGAYLRDFRALLDRYDYDCALYGHFGEGCIHCRINFDYSTRPGIERYLAFIDEAADLVLRYGGSISGEHGDGQSRGALLEKMYGSELVEAFREFKRIWDPAWRMNPGKVVDAFGPGENLLLGPDYAPGPWETTFQFPETDFSFAEATVRCVGVGKCRKQSGGVMCPSYMVTKEETHSTRGRARLLHEMVRGEVIRDGWRSEEVRGALDLCLSCKGCKSECPLHVDVATYKAEFMSHFYRGRLRPRAAYAMGLIHWAARAAAMAPELVNAVLDIPAVAGALKRIGGIAAERDLPTFADYTFRDWFRRRDASAGGQRIILWPDTFNNHFHPDVGRAAAEILEAVGFNPVLPPRALCCGRPLYDFGMLDLARHQLRQILHTLRPDIRAGTFIVGMEPSCVAVFRDELVNLFPHDEDAHRLARQTYLLSEFLVAHAPDADLGSLRGETALVHGHCHHRAVLNFGAELALLGRIGIDYHVLDSGCCGMAGPFGFQEEHYDVAQACAERVLLPAVREADPRTLLITSGFSCREMVEQNRLRRPLHVAEVVHMAMERAGRLPTLARRPRDVAGARRPVSALLALAAGLGAGYAAFRIGKVLARSPIATGRTGSSRPRPPVLA
jgi:FAD/FMN-containing dehydrogenase/Fe-S oxidoreductase